MVLLCLKIKDKEGSYTERVTGALRLKQEDIALYGRRYIATLLEVHAPTRACLSACCIEYK